MMPEANVAFVGSVPVNYDRYMGPIFFHHYADDLAERLVVTDGMRGLETACGTGIHTRRLLDRLGGRGSLVATDLNPAMIDHARALVTAPGVEWQPADATARSRAVIRRRHVPVRAHVLSRQGDGHPRSSSGAQVGRAIPIQRVGRPRTQPGRPRHPRDCGHLLSDRCAVVLHGA